MKHTCNNCANCVLDLAEFGVSFRCGRDVKDMSLGCMDWRPYAPMGDKRVLIESYRALKRGDPEKAARLMAHQLDRYHEGAAYWESAPEVPKND